VGFFFKVLKMKQKINKHPNDANMLLSVRFACAAGSQRKSLRALWLIVGSKLTDNVSSVCAVSPIKVPFNLTKTI